MVPGTRYGTRVPGPGRVQWYPVVQWYIFRRVQQYQVAGVLEILHSVRDPPTPSRAGVEVFWEGFRLFKSVPHLIEEIDRLKKV